MHSRQPFRDRINMRSIHSRKPSVNQSFINKTTVNSTPQKNNQDIDEYNRLKSEISSTLMTLNMTKHQQIRVTQWLNKLSVKPCNVVWSSNRNFYLQVLLKMLKKQILLEPFINLPPQGSLPKLTLYDVPFPVRHSDYKQLSNKTTKKNQPQSHRAGNKQQHIFKGQCRVNIQIREENKQNQFNLDNILKPKKKLFKYQKQLSTMRTDYTSLGNTNQEVKTQYFDQKPEEDTKGLNLLIKTLRLFGKHYQQLYHMPMYRKIVDKIVQVGLKMNVDLRDAILQENLKNTSEQNNFNKTFCESKEILKESKSIFQKTIFNEASQQIKDKFTKTDQQTMEFMEYLKIFKRKVNKSVLK